LQIPNNPLDKSIAVDGVAMDGVVKQETVVQYCSPCIQHPMIFHKGLLLEKRTCYDAAKNHSIDLYKTASAFDLASCNSSMISDKHICIMTQTRIG
jgi:hypothetical protein